MSQWLKKSLMLRKQAFLKQIDIAILTNSCKQDQETQSSYGRQSVKQNAFIHNDAHQLLTCLIDHSDEMVTSFQVPHGGNMPLS